MFAINQLTIKYRKTKTQLDNLSNKEVSYLDKDTGLVLEHTMMRLLEMIVKSNRPKQYKGKAVRAIVANLTCSYGEYHDILQTDLKKANIWLCNHDLQGFLSGLDNRSDYCPLPLLVNYDVDTMFLRNIDSVLRKSRREHDNHERTAFSVYSYQNSLVGLFRWLGEVQNNPYELNDCQKLLKIMNDKGFLSVNNIDDFGGGFNTLSLEERIKALLPLNLLYLANTACHDMHNRQEINKFLLHGVIYVKNHDFIEFLTTDYWQIINEIFPNMQFFIQKTLQPND